MAGNLEGTIPDAWMQASAVNQVIGFVSAMGIPTRLKQQLFYKWAFTVGYTVTPSDLERVKREVG
jgi:hypothetical protein